MKLKKEKIPRLIVTTIATILIILGTVGVVAYSRGYRFNNRLGLVEKTGVLNIESNPYRTDVYIDGESKGKTPKTISSIREGMHKVEVFRDGYHDWKKTVEIKYEKSTPIYPHLFLVEPEKEDVFSAEDETVEIYHDQETNYIFAITRKEISSIGDLASTDQQNDFLYKIWRFNTNPNFWSAQDNPILIFEKEVVNLEEFSFIPSTTTEYALIKIGTASTSDILNYETYLLNTDQSNNPEEIDLTKYLATYSINWAEDDEALVLQSDNDLLSLNLSSNEDTILVEEVSEPVWSTDESGNFYYIEHIDETEESPPYMQILQMPLDGNSPVILVDKIFYSTDGKYLPKQQDFEQRDELFIFTNSPDASQFAGKITNLKILNDINMIFIETEFASYFYDIESDKYTLVSVLPSSLIEISPDENKLLLQTEDTIQLFIFDKEEANHVTQLGSNTLIRSRPDRVKWHNGSRVVFYSENGKFKSIDSNRSNNFEIVDIDENFFALENSGDNIFGIDLEEGVLLIQKVKIN